MPNALNIEGKKFNRLTVITKSDKRDRSGTVQWLCRCDCGKETLARGVSLISGNTKSCGCYSRERHAEVCKRRNHKHGLHGTPTYNTWQAMLGRCTNPNDPKFPLYGARGITVCSEWLEFTNFLADMGLRPKGKTIDRINNNGNYEKSNCRWADIFTQQNNTRTNYFIEFKGKRQTLAQWCREYGLPKNTLKNRIHKLGWTIDKALQTPRQIVYRRPVKAS